MDYSPVIEKIRKDVPDFRLVDFAATFEALRERGLPAMPAVFLLPGNEAAGRNDRSRGAVHQAVRFQFRLYLFVKYAGDALGAAATDYLEALRGPLRAALLGWQPPVEGVDGEVEFDGGRPEQLANGILVWRDQFAFDGYYRKVT